ncbi:MAG: cyclic pyranopterin monophosphate synthase MoaC [Cyclobacteriaceae bacterium]|nr:cyclic pyranopterin monophosphate synthase MoaC [Cyclobacteriaceae bacterium]MCK5281617.1 cyclic pyranopterin monophosphate synthase MoaC [Cyclobacteriaceae bacterium]MCK5371731.1 cyclic pyranopterin monophosphate synthase MoaC [Cyclobacteriaceae bacterium]MCK5467507.1 cyclic pyranopterin monophosphate synthase MoaC [Cyclobacteriaceae bacterium]
MGEFSHLDKSGKATMVDVGKKTVTRRTAIAQATIILPDPVMKHFNGNDLDTKKGGVFQTAILAGIMGAKKTSDLIPLCHPLSLDNCAVDIKVANNNELMITAEASIESKTGVEMEALTAASIAALTVYDMCKGLSHDIIIKEIKLLSKSGGKSDFKRT